MAEPEPTAAMMMDTSDAPPECCREQQHVVRLDVHRREEV